MKESSARSSRSTRRTFLATSTATAVSLTAGPCFFGPLFGQGPSGRMRAPGGLASDPMRPQFHLLPASNWMNDPNGPIYFNGNYHMFFQYNPLAATWGDMSWDHAISKDMLHWSHLPVAMTPTAGSPDSFGCFSGSALQVGKRVYAVYTGTRESTPELATIRDGQNKIQESQCLAWSDDPVLKTWTKDPKPVIPLPPAGMNVTGFRDPSAWKEGEWFYMTVGSGVAKVGGCVLLYRSKDLRSWEYLHKLTEGQWNGHKTPNPCDDGEMWECPDFFALDGGHVLIYSTLGKVFWQSGSFDSEAMTFQPRKTGLLDLDAFYAPKTQRDAQGRRILWGWIPERRSEAAMRDAGWSGMMSLPRVLKLDPDGTLRIQILPQTAVLRSGTVTPLSKEGEISLTLERANGEVLCTAEPGASFEVSLNAGPATILQVSYDAQGHTVTADGKRIELKAEDKPELHAYVDGSVLELIVSSKIGYTKRFYYEEAQAPDLKMKIKGTHVHVQAWKVAPISDNRLTTPASQPDSEPNP